MAQKHRSSPLALARAVNQLTRHRPQLMSASVPPSNRTRADLSSRIAAARADHRIASPDRRAQAAHPAPRNPANPRENGTCVSGDPHISLDRGLSHLGNLKRTPVRTTQLAG